MTSRWKSPLDPKFNIIHSKSNCDFHYDVKSDSALLEYKSGSVYNITLNRIFEENDVRHANLQKKKIWQYIVREHNYMRPIYLKQFWVAWSPTQICKSYISCAVKIKLIEIPINDHIHSSSYSWICKLFFFPFISYFLYNMCCCTGALVKQRFHKNRSLCINNCHGILISLNPPTPNKSKKCVILNNSERWYNDCKYVTIIKAYRLIFMKYFLYNYVLSYKEKYIQLHISLSLL